MRFLAAIVAMLIASVVSAQTTSGRISGTVLDTSQAPIKDATVTVTNQATGLTQTATTDQSGAYVFTNLPRGTYTVSAEVNGFKKSVRSDNELVADGRVSVDFHMELGQVTESIEVTSPGEAVNRTSGEVARTVDREQVQNLALNGRNYLTLATLMPGAPLNSGNYNTFDNMTGLGINMNINGGRGNSSSLTVDGEFNMDSGSNNSQISNVGVDFIEEVNVKTSNFSAEYGRNSGAAINIVTRSGSNKFHGGAFEEHRQESLDANDYFLNKTGKSKTPLKFNDFGWTLGGPLVTDKLFFFAGQEWKQIDRSAAPAFKTLPTTAMRNGNFSALSTVIKDPLTGLPFPGNIIPANRITADGRAIANVYTAMQAQANSYVDTATGNNASFVPSTPFRFRQEILRLDYQPSAAHRLTIRGIHDTYKLTDPFGTFITSDLPTVPTERTRPGNNYQVSDTWTISPTMINELKLGASWHGQRIPPAPGTTSWQRDTYGFTFPQVYTNGGAYENSIPDVAIQGYSGFKGAAQSLIAPTTDESITDSLTVLKGNHTLKFGAAYTHNRKDQNGRPTYAGNVNFGTTNTHTSGNTFADALLGNFSSYSENQLDPTGHFRFSQIEGFVDDAWRVSQKLSVDIGVRYMWQQPMFTAANNMANFVPALYDPSKAVTVNPNGTLVPGSGNVYNGLIRAGDGVPDSELGRVPIGNSPLVLSVPAGAPRGFYDAPSLFAPRFSFAWSADERTSFRGGIGLFFDRPEGNLLFGGASGGLINNPPYVLSSQYNNGNLSQPGGGSVPALSALGGIAAIDPALKVPRTWQWSGGFQRELGGGVFAELTYVGSKGVDLLRQIDINLPSFSVLQANAAAKNATNYVRPYKGYSAIGQRVSDGESKYNSLQVFLSKRRGALRWTLSYTLSKSTDNASGNDGQTGIDYALDPAGSFGPSDYDRRHVGVATLTWQLPIFPKRQGIGAILGGWEASVIGRAQSGSPFSVVGPTSIGTRRADFAGGDPYSTIDTSNGTLLYLNKAAFTTAPDSRLGNTTRNQFYGPGYWTADLAFRKNFTLKGETKLGVDINLFNVFNHVNLLNPAADLSNAGTFGTISSAAPPRNIQVGGRFSF